MEREKSDLVLGSNSEPSGAPEQRTVRLKLRGPPTSNVAQKHPRVNTAGNARERVEEVTQGLPSGLYRPVASGEQSTNKIRTQTTAR